jgi:hypothetical protein
VRVAAKSKPGLEAFRQRAEATMEAFNRGDFEAAWASLPDDFEFHSIPQ